MGTYPGTVNRTQAPTATQAGAARWFWLVPASITAGLLGGLWIAGSWWQGPAPGASDPGSVVGWGLPISRALAMVAAISTVGWLTSAAFLAHQGRQGVLSRVARRDVQRAGWSALAWWLAATATMLFNHAMMVGLPLGEALSPGVLRTYLFAVDTTIAFSVTALCAAVVAAATPWISRSGSAAVLLAVALIGVAAPAVTGHSHGLGDHGLAIVSGLSHAGSAAVWMGALLAVAWHIVRRDPGLRLMLPRYSSLSAICLVVLALSGIGAAYARVERPGDLFSTGYGWLVSAKVVLLLGLALAALGGRRAIASTSDSTLRVARFWRWLVGQALVMGLAVGVAVALTRTPNTRIPVPLASPAEEVLGFPFPPAPSVGSVLGGWHPDPFWLVVGALCMGLYGAGAWTLHKRGDRWPAGRTVSWLLGTLILVWATCGQIAAYATASVSYHMLQHMVLAMLVPIFLVLGAPITLALRALRPSRTGDRGAREWIVWGVHRPATALLTHPLAVLAITVFSLFGMYFTGLFPALMSNHLGHLAMQIHFVVAGYLFYWVLVGVDPTTRQVPYGVKIIVLLISLGLHAFFGIAIMMMTQPLGDSWFALVQPPWLADLVRDTYVAGGIAWALGEIPTLVVLISICVQWAASDERLARRLDRAADRDGDADLRAYNDHLAALARRDR